MAKAGLGQSQEPETLSGSFMCVARTPTRGPSFAGFPRAHQQEAGSEVVLLRLQLALTQDAGITGGGLRCCASMLVPEKGCIY